MKYLNNFNKVNESMRESMINVIKNVLNDIYNEDNKASIDDVIEEFSNKMFINDDDKKSFIKSCKKIK